MRGRDLGRGFLITLAVFCFASVSWSQGADQTARVLFNAKVFTGVPDHPYADAVAIRGDRIVAVGSLAEVSAIDPSADASRPAREVPASRSHRQPRSSHRRRYHPDLRRCSQ